jgi:hypothetical protein
MRLRTSTIEPRHLCRRCMQCGQMQPASRAPATCVTCGCDFQQRPPRSYAEMEGLVDFTEDPGAEAFGSWYRTLAFERWLLTAFTAVIVAAFLVHVGASLLP